MIEGKSPSFYINHTVGTKENYYSIGRMYNISPSMNIAPFNGLNMSDGLKIGQLIMIPLTENNFSQDGKAEKDEALIPIHYKATSRQALYQIGQRFNNVPSASLKKWNKLSADQAAEGMDLIIGFLKVKADLSPLASAKSVTYDVPVKVPEKTDNAVSAVTEKPIKPSLPEKKEEPVSLKNNSGGFFRSQYEKQRDSHSGESQSGMAGIFKSTSGWDDGKYYCLNDKAEAGTIIKITNNRNQRTVYAKVLDAMPDMKQNEGLILRLSNAAAAELGAGEENFDCTIQF
jgi:LysM repeat protein